MNSTLPGPALLCIQLTSNSWEKFLKVGKFLRKLALTSPTCTRKWMFRRRWYNHRQMQTGGKLLEKFLGSSLLRKEHSWTLPHFTESLQFLDFSLMGLWFPQLREEGKTLPLTGIIYSLCINPPVTQKNTEPGAGWEMEHVSDPCELRPQSTFCPNSPSDDPFSSQKPFPLQFSMNEQWLLISWYFKGTRGFRNLSFKGKNAAFCQVLRAGALRTWKEIALTQQGLIPAMSELTKSRNNSKKWWI